MPILNLQELFEELNENIDKPIRYNHILSNILQELNSGLSPITYVEGMAYLNDPFRGKILSATRPTITAGWYGLNQTNRYLRVEGVTTFGDSGFLLPRDATITALWAKSRSAGNWNIEIRKNNAPITLAAVPVSGGFGASTVLDFDVNQGDTIQFYLSGAAVDHPIVGLEIAWRAT